MRSSPRFFWEPGRSVTTPSFHRSRRFCRILLVEVQVELQHIDRRLAEEPEEPAVRVRGQHLANLLGTDTARRGDRLT